MKRVFFILLTALPIVMTGCVKEILGNHAHGQIIVFTANTTYDNLPATKTEYSGIDENGHPVTGTSAKERINWVDTDRIRIYSDEATDRYSANHYADYVIIPGANSGCHRTQPASSCHFPRLQLQACRYSTFLDCGCLCPPAPAGAAGLQVSD